MTSTTTTERPFPFPIGRRVRFDAGPFTGFEGTVEKISANGIMVVRGDPLHGRDGAGFSVDVHEGAQWDVVLADPPVPAPLPASADTAKAETWFCRNCGGLDIKHDATVSWNPDRQDWDVIDVQDNHWCEACLPSEESDPVFGIPGDGNATTSMIGGGA